MFFREHALPRLQPDLINSSRLRLSFSGRTGSGIVASRAEEYRSRAHQCLEMARAFGDRDAQVTLAHMAQACCDWRQDTKKVRPAVQQQQQMQPKDGDRE